MSEGWNIAVLGATGAVGEALLETLAERQFPVGEIYALARNESAGEQLRFGGKTITVQDAAEFDWTQAQLTGVSKSEDWSKSQLIPQFSFIIRCFFDYLQSSSSFLPRA